MADPYRLPRTVVPIRYDLRLEPDLADAAFAGEVVVALNVNEATPEIVLNAVELTIDGARLQMDSGLSLEATATLDERLERCTLAFNRSTGSGNGRLYLRFHGILNDNLRGFYRSSYRDAAGATKVLAATQFEATDARRAFPCWDEPSFKAVFATTLVVEPSLVAISNTAIASEKNQGGKKVVRFADTIPMSTYLVAFVVGELEATTPILVGNTPLRVWSVPGKSQLAAFAQEIGTFSLKFYEDYYGRPYPGDKLDLLAIPDFAAGAMENLGAITFRETALLVDERAATHAELERVADVVAHEIAHMWFGDLVTMAWWNGLWLNEAFATFLEMVAVDAFKPEWQRWTSFGVSRAAALVVDGLHSTRPIEYPVEAPKDADAMFDVLTYEKGASVLRMLEQYLGVETFRAGVREYLHAHAFGNTETGDLWLALERASQQPIPQIMNCWVFQPGYPLLEVRREGDSLVLTQQRFTYLPAVNGKEQRWHVPVQVRVRRGDAVETQRLLLKDSDLRMPLPDDCDDVVVNSDGQGFYRVHYSDELRERLLRTMSEGLSPIERFNLLNDCWAATLAGQMPVTAYLELTAHFRGERDKNVWAVLFGSFQALHRIVEAAERAGFERVVRDRVGGVLADLGWTPQPGESELTGQLRGDAIRALGILGSDAAVQQRAAEIYGQSLRASSAASADVLAAVIPVLAYVGDQTRYDEFWEHFRSAKTPQDEQRYLHALPAFRPAPLVQQTLTRTLDGGMRTQDAPFVLRSLLSAPHARAEAWGFVKTNWNAINRLYPPVGVRRMMEGIVGLATPELERDVQEFVRERKVDLGGKVLAQYLEQLRIAVSLREREGKALSAYLTM
jgi:puromycin-sensitive aminopeptidase